MGCLVRCKSNVAVSVQFDAVESHVAAYSDITVSCELVLRERSCLYASVKYVIARGSRKVNHLGGSAEDPFLRTNDSELKFLDRGKTSPRKSVHYT